MSAAKSDPPRVPQGRHGLPREVNQGYAATSAAFYLATFLGYEELRRSQEVTS